MEIVPTPNFEREFKRLYKRHGSLRADMETLCAQLMENPLLGVPLGHDCFKIRLSISSKSRGKSGGARVITYVQIAGDSIFLLSIFDKSAKADLAPGELSALLRQV